MNAVIFAEVSKPKKQSVTQNFNPYIKFNPKKVQDKEQNKYEKRS